MLSVCSIYSGVDTPVKIAWAEFTFAESDGELWLGSNNIYLLS